MKKSYVALAIGSVAALTFALAAMAGPGGHLRAFLHGPGGWGGHGDMHGAVAELVAKLDLRPDQQAHIDTIHGILSERMTAHRAGIGEHLEVLIERIDKGSINETEAHLHIDDRIETMRSTAYLVSDELVALINSLDDQQRATLTEHLSQLQSHLQQMQEMGFLGHGPFTGQSVDHGEASIN